MMSFPEDMWIYDEFPKTWWIYNELIINFKENFQAVIKNFKTIQQQCSLYYFIYLFMHIFNYNGTNVYVLLYRVLCCTNMCLSAMIFYL